MLSKQNVFPSAQSSLGAKPEQFTPPYGLPARPQLKSHDCRHQTPSSTQRENAECAVCGGWCAGGCTPHMPREDVHDLIPREAQFVHRRLPALHPRPGRICHAGVRKPARAIVHVPELIHRVEGGLQLLLSEGHRRNRQHNIKGRHTSRHGRRRDNHSSWMQPPSSNALAGCGRPTHIIESGGPRLAALHPYSEQAAGDPCLCVRPNQRCLGLNLHDDEWSHLHPRFESDECRCEGSPRYGRQRMA